MNQVDGSERYYAKRRAGLSNIRRDGSRTNPHTDRHADAAEQFVCKLFRQPYNSDIYDTHGDGGQDFQLGPYGVEIIHLGMIENHTKPRLEGNLIVNPHEPWRWAHIYISVRGSMETGFEIIGWCSHADIVSRPMRNFGYGNRYWVPIEELSDIKPLITACVSEPESSS